MTPISVLYVDDEPSLLEIGKHFLERKGQFSVDTIASAPAALTLLNEKKYDAIISDYQMPEMDGIAFLKKIRSSGNTIPFILFTGRGREEIIIQALNEGADFYLQKGGEPVSQFTELAHQIRQATQKRRAEANIRDLERRESDLLNFQPDATVAIDRSGLVIAWNRAMEEVTGVSAAEILGKGNYEYSIPFYGRRQPTLIDLIFESDEIIAKEYAHILHKNDTLIADAIFPTLKGVPVTFMAMASPLYDRQGKIIGAIESVRDITERKRSEEALRESERQYRQIVETTDEGIWKLDETFDTAYVNRWMADMLGYTPEEMIGRSYSSFMAAEDKPDQTVLMEERREGKRGRYECRFITKDGRTRWLQVSSTPLLDQDGTFRGSFGMCSDITDRKTAEEEIACRNQELRAAYEQLTATEGKLQQNYNKLVKSRNLLLESERQYRRIVETTDEGIYQLDEKLKMVYVNSRMAEMHGCTPEEMRGQNITLFMVAEDIPENTSRIKERKGGKSGRYERRFVTKDGKVRWLQVSSTPLFDAGGTFRGSFAMYSDITDRKATEEKLRDNYDELAKSQILLLESEKQYRRIVETANEGILQVDENFETVYVNQQMADMLGYTQEEMMGRSLISFIAEEDRPDHIMRLEVAREGKRGRFERRFITKDGKVRWIQVSATPLLDQNGTFRGSFGMCSDVTDHKAAEEKLRQNYDELVKIQKLLLESEKQYRQIVETTNEGIGKLDEKFETIYVNRRMADMLGYTPEEMIGRSYTSFMATEDVPDQTSRLEERRQGKSSRYERRFVTKDGKVRWIYVSATPILDPDGTFRGSFAMHSDITDRKAAEEGIVRSNEKLHATNKHLSAAEEKLQRNYDKLVKSQRMLAEAMDLANLVNWECDLNTGILTFDDRFSTLYGTNAKYKGINHMTAEAYLQKVVHPEDFHILAEEDEKTRNTTDPHYVSKREYRIIRGDGEVRHIEMCVGVTKDAKGRTIKTHGVNHDITERKKAEVALRESEEKFRKLVEYTLDGILILDFQGKILFVNQTAGQIVGAENYREMVSRRNVLEFIAPESQGDALRDFSQVAKGTDGYLARYKIITTTGLERWIECIGKNIRFERAPAILISICDITERKKAEVALRVSEEKFRSFVENAIDIMYSITPDGIYTYISPQCTELLGYETSEVLGKPAAAFIHPDDFPHNCECFRHTIRTGEKKNGIIFRIRHKNGTWRWYATTESPVHDAGGKVVAIQGICHDITERKEADEALRLANHRLNLLGSITRHDINNKITATFGYLKLAEMKSRDPALGVYFGKMESTITEIQSQIEFARIYHDLGTKAPQWIALNTAMSRLQVPATITLNSNVQGVEVFADPMLEKVFTNLLDNSIRHGKRVTEIRVSSKKSGGELVVIWEDNGIGVAADEKARIFERGFGKNSGLGLFLIREILSLTGITITETGEPGKGTRFEISIPDGKYRFITKYREETVLNESS